MAKRGKGLLVALGLGDPKDEESGDSELCDDILQAVRDKDSMALGDALDAYIGDYLDKLRGDEDDEDDEY